MYACASGRGETKLESAVSNKKSAEGFFTFFGSTLLMLSASLSTPSPPLPSPSLPPQPKS